MICGWRDHLEKLQLWREIGDLSVFYHPGNGVHVGQYYGFSSGLTGKTKVVSAAYVATIDDSANIIFLPYWS